MQRDFKHCERSSDISQLSSTRVHNILELSWMSLLCWLSASLLKKKRYHKSIYRLAYPNERFSSQIFVYFNCYDSFNTATCFLILMLKVTLHEYVCAYVSYRPLPLHSNYRVGFRNINMHAYCHIKSFGTPLRLHDNLLCLHHKKIIVVYYSFSS